MKGKIRVTKHCLERFRQRFERHANRSRVERVAKVAKPLWRKLKRRIESYRREHGLKAIEWRDDYEYFVSMYRRALWVVKHEDGVRILLTVWKFES